MEQKKGYLISRLLTPIARSRAVHDFFRPDAVPVGAEQDIGSPSFWALSRFLLVSDP